MTLHFSPLPDFYPTFVKFPALNCKSHPSLISLKFLPVDFPDFSHLLYLKWGLLYYSKTHLPAVQSYLENASFPAQELHLSKAPAEFEVHNKALLNQAEWFLIYNQ